VPVPDTETKPAVVGKGGNQVTHWEDRRYSRTHECNLPRGARAVLANGGEVVCCQPAPPIRPPAPGPAVEGTVFLRPA
jgi:hypothetical protein